MYLFSKVPDILNLDIVLRVPPRMAYRVNPNKNVGTKSEDGQRGQEEASTMTTCDHEVWSTRTILAQEASFLLLLSGQCRHRTR